ncbi:MAG TPA: recombination regulator RecX [Candidatus Mediterraneibacter excrementavium]|nr:recombination regulator RecX [Candidatus Mediterraneibacter excrementavium]
MKVTGIEPCSKTKYKISLDGKFAFVLYKGELSRFHIREGEELSEETQQKIYSDVLLKRAKLRALHLLSDMDRTENALREKLRLGLYPQEIIDAAVEYVRSFGYLNDARYAENFVRSRQGIKSRREIRAQLLQKGVPSELIEDAFEACGEEGGEADAIRRLLEKKRFDPVCADEREIQRLYGYLARKGFSYETVRQVIQNYEVDA